jgi:dTDP-4-amino-4,6-dideoxygalactose transaminase
VIVVDLYGQCAERRAHRRRVRRHGVRLIEDAAEALGATYQGRPAGSLGDLSILSFNGNKIITTSGGGMLLRVATIASARSRALPGDPGPRAPARHYEHADIGYNYRLSNLLAAVGRAQLGDLAAPGRGAPSHLRLATARPRRACLGGASCPRRPATTATAG